MTAGDDIRHATVAEVARLLGCSERVVRARIRRGKIRAEQARAGGPWPIPVRDAPREDEDAQHSPSTDGGNASPPQPTADVVPDNTTTVTPPAPGTADARVYWCSPAEAAQQLGCAEGEIAEAIARGTLDVGTLYPGGPIAVALPIALLKHVGESAHPPPDTTAVAELDGDVWFLLLRLLRLLNPRSIGITAMTETTLEGFGTALEREIAALQGELWRLGIANRHLRDSERRRLERERRDKRRQEH